MFWRTGGGGAKGIGVAFEHFLCPLSAGFWPQILPQTAVLLSPEKDILSNLNYFPFPRVRNLSQKIANAAPALTPSHLPFRPSNEISIFFTCK